MARLAQIKTCRKLVKRIKLSNTVKKLKIGQSINIC